MCGISGVHTARSTELPLSEVRRMVALQHRRGPDCNAVESIQGRHAQTVLGHNRLAVIDLSADAKGPMWDVDHRFCLSYNGEIYNYIELRRELESLGHRFRTASDSEVVLEAFKQWGIEAVNRFNGMFAFALLDTRTDRLLLFRDRFGVKPLYYLAGGDTLRFASTAGPIAEVAALSPNLDYVARALRYWVFDYADDAPYAGLKALKPGHYLEAAIDHAGRLRTTVRSYYDLGERIATTAEMLAGMSSEERVQSAAELLDDAVRIRLRSDVPIAVSLSGGLDSSTVAALAAEHHAGTLRGFTFGHPRARASEGPLVERLRRRIGIDVTYVWPGRDELRDAFCRTLHAQDTPILSGSIMAQHLVFRAARQAGFKVLLGGQGGDEAFMGYRKFQAFHLRRLIHEKRYAGASAYLLASLSTVAAELPGVLHYWHGRHRYTRRSGIATTLCLPEPEAVALGYDPAEPLRRRQLRDVTCLSLPTLLQYEDRNSMGNSVESRLPFVDYRVVQFGLALPEAAKLHKGFGKWIVREAVRGKIPESIRRARYKRGFDVAGARWIDECLGELIREMLHERSRRINDWLEGPIRIDAAFSNTQLKKRPGAFAEATTLIWLADKTVRSRAERGNEGASTSRLAPAATPGMASTR